MTTAERDETRDRFLAAIAERLDPERIEEIHLFVPLKQSGFESGVAVVAVNEHAARTGAASADHSETAVESRRAVYTAKYRLTLKGPDRGKWDFSMHADADAPLVTVDKVVQGVMRRSGDAEDPEKLSGDELRAHLPPREPVPTPGQSV